MANAKTGPNLAAAVRAIEKLMDDTCDITRDAQQEFDDTLDYATGNLAQPANDSLIAYQGRCTLFPSSSYQETDIGGQRTAQRDYDLSLPLQSAEICMGDVVTMVSSRRDPRLAGQKFSVTDVVSGTFEISQRVRVSRR